MVAKNMNLVCAKSLFVLMSVLIIAQASFAGQRKVFERPAKPRVIVLTDITNEPDDEESVGIVLELANHYGIPLTPRGAGSATTGTTTPEQGGWVLDLSGWDQIHIDPVARMAFVQPGVTLGDLDAAAAQYGLSYPPDPSLPTPEACGEPNTA